MKTKLFCMAALVIAVGVWAQGSRSPVPIQKPAPVTPEVMHASVVNTFVRSEVLGLSRMPTVHRSFIPEIVLGEKVYRVKLAQLIGLENNPEPIAYITPGVTPDKLYMRAAIKNKTIQTRPLTSFEKDALEQFKAGTHLAFGTNSGVPVIAGSLVATTECLNCHSGKEGKLLGAMSYALEEILMKPVEGKEIYPGQSGQSIKISALTPRN